jgi:hypothetical protein
MNVLGQPMRTDQRILMVCIVDGHDRSLYFGGGVLMASREAFIMPKCQAVGKVRARGTGKGVQTMGLTFK